MPHLANIWTSFAIPEHQHKRMYYHGWGSHYRTSGNGYVINVVSQPTSRPHMSKNVGEDFEFEKRLQQERVRWDSCITSRIILVINFLAHINNLIYNANMSCSIFNCIFVAVLVRTSTFLCSNSIGHTWAHCQTGMLFLNQIMHLMGQSCHLSWQHINDCYLEVLLSMGKKTHPQIPVSFRCNAPQWLPGLQPITEEVGDYLDKRSSQYPYRELYQVYGCSAEEEKEWTTYSFEDVSQGGIYFQQTKSPSIVRRTTFLVSR
jgi:hypothetical protein